MVKRTSCSRSNCASMKSTMPTFVLATAIASVVAASALCARPSRPLHDLVE